MQKQERVPGENTGEHDSSSGNLIVMKTHPGSLSGERLDTIQAKSLLLWRSTGMTRDIYRPRRYFKTVEEESPGIQSKGRGDRGLFSLRLDERRIHRMSHQVREGHLGWIIRSRTHRWGKTAWN